MELLVDAEHLLLILFAEVEAVLAQIFAFLTAPFAQSGFDLESPGLAGRVAHEELIVPDEDGELLEHVFQGLAAAEDRRKYGAFRLGLRDDLELFDTDVLVVGLDLAVHPLQSVSQWVHAPYRK